MADLTTEFEISFFEVGDRVAFEFAHQRIFGDSDPASRLLGYRARGHNFPGPLLWHHRWGRPDRTTIDDSRDLPVA